MRMNGRHAVVTLLVAAALAVAASRVSGDPMARPSEHGRPADPTVTATAEQHEGLTSLTNGRRPVLAGDARRVGTTDALAVLAAVLAGVSSLRVRRLGRLRHTSTRSRIDGAIAPSRGPPTAFA